MRTIKVGLAYFSVTSSMSSRSGRRALWNFVKLTAHDSCGLRGKSDEGSRSLNCVCVFIHYLFPCLFLLVVLSDFQKVINFIFFVS